MKDTVDLKYQTQKFRHDPKNGTIGDCFPTCLACLLEIPREQVPHFFEADYDGDPAPQWEHVENWLKGHGYRLLRIYFSGVSNYLEVIASVGKSNPDYRFLFSAESKTGVNHVVIAKNGKIDHDPSIDQVGIVGPWNGMYCVEFLVPIGASQ